MGSSSPSRPVSPAEIPSRRWSLKEIITPEALANLSNESFSTPTDPTVSTRIYETLEFLIQYVKNLKLEEIVREEHYLEQLMQAKGQLEGTERGTRYTKFIVQFTIIFILRDLDDLDSLSEDARRKIYCWLSLPEKKLNDLMRDQLKNLGWSDDEDENWKTMHEGHLFWAFIWERIRDGKIFTEDPCKKSTDAGDYIKKHYLHISLRRWADGSVRVLTIISKGGRGQAAIITRAQAQAVVRAYMSSNWSRKFNKNDKDWHTPLEIEGTLHLRDESMISLQPRMLHISDLVYKANARLPKVSCQRLRHIANWWYSETNMGLDNAARTYKEYRNFIDQNLSNGIPPISANDLRKATNVPEELLTSIHAQTQNAEAPTTAVGEADPSTTVRGGLIEDDEMLDGASYLSNHRALIFYDSCSNGTERASNPTSSLISLENTEPTCSSSFTTLDSVGSTSLPETSGEDDHPLVKELAKLTDFPSDKRDFILRTLRPYIEAGPGKTGVTSAFNKAELLGAAAPENPIEDVAGQQLREGGSQSAGQKRHVEDDEESLEVAPLAAKRQRTIVGDPAMVNDQSTPAIQCGDNEDDFDLDHAPDHNGLDL